MPRFLYLLQMIYHLWIYPNQRGQTMGVRNITKASECAVPLLTACRLSFSGGAEGWRGVSFSGHYLRILAWLYGGEHTPATTQAGAPPLKFKFTHKKYADFATDG